MDLKLSGQFTFYVTSLLITPHEFENLHAGLHSLSLTNFRKYHKFNNYNIL